MYMGIRQVQFSGEKVLMRYSEQATRVAIYARVSTCEGTQDPEMQLSEAREYASRRGLQISKEYIDAGVSGCRESRPALNEMMADAARRCLSHRFGEALVPRTCRTLLCWSSLVPQQDHGIKGQRALRGNPCRHQPQQRHGEDTPCQYQRIAGCRLIHDER
jgi:resolvase-like protein